MGHHFGFYCPSFLVPCIWMFTLRRETTYPSNYYTYILLPLNVDFINENTSVGNPDPTPRIASIHNLNSPWLCLWNVGWRLFTITSMVKRCINYKHATSFTERGSRAYGIETWINIRDARAWQYVHACKAEDEILQWLGKFWFFCGRNVLLHGNLWRLRLDGLSLKFWQKSNLVRYAHSCVFF